MAVSMQSTSSGGTINFSEGDTLTVNGKIVAQGIVSPDTGHVYADVANAQKVNQQIRFDYTYTVLADGILSISVYQKSNGNSHGITVYFNDAQIHKTQQTTSTISYSLSSIPCKMNDAIRITTDYSSDFADFNATFYPYR